MFIGIFCVFFITIFFTIHSRFYLTSKQASSRDDFEKKYIWLLLIAEIKDLEKLMPMKPFIHGIRRNSSQGQRML